MTSDPAGTHSFSQLQKQVGDSFNPNAPNRPWYLKTIGICGSGPLNMRVRSLLRGVHERESVFFTLFYHMGRSSQPTSKLLCESLFEDISGRCLTSPVVGPVDVESPVDGAIPPPIPPPGSPPLPSAPQPSAPGTPRGWTRSSGIRHVSLSKEWSFKTGPTQKEENSEL